jgi:hypothetical protein
MSEKKTEEKAAGVLVGDSEIKALFKMGQQLQELDADARARCLFYLCQKYAPPGFSFAAGERATGPSAN